MPYVVMAVADYGPMIPTVSCKVVLDVILGDSMSAFVILRCCR
jgi:hypothetical protein